jgi:hypothetical protein
MRVTSFLVGTLFFFVISSVHAQLIGAPSNQGGATPPPPNVSTAPPTVSVTTPGSSDQLSTIPPQSLNGLPPRSLNRSLISPPNSQGREQPERPAGPLR